MKTIKFLATRLLMVSLAFSIFSCENEDKRTPTPTPDPGETSSSIVGKWEAKKVKNITTGGDWYTPSKYQLLDIKADGTFGTENHHHGVYTYIGNKLTLSYLTADVTVYTIVLSLTQTELHWRSDAEMALESNVLEYIWERVGSGGGGGGTDPNSSEVTFWVNWDDGGGIIYVNINGTTKDITSYYPGETTIDGCNEVGCANFTLSPGTYSYTANDANESWQGTFTLSAGQCYLIHLYHGSGGGGGGGGSNSGKASFWIQSDLGCGNITVNINGTTKMITGYSPSGFINCDTAGFANFTLSPGAYSYSASCSSLTWNGTVNITSGGCQPIQLTENGGGGGGSNSGKATFWTKSDLGCGNITVNINGTTRTITGYLSGGIGNGCDVSGCANFTLSPGSYSYSASSSGGMTWNGTVNISANGCNQIQLTGNCNGGGGGGGGGSNSGKVTFWTQSDLGCGNISVKINGTTRTITGYLSGGIGNGCDVSGCANFTLSPGTYSFSAKCSAYTWNGTVNISANGCLQYHLY